MGDNSTQPDVPSIQTQAEPDSPRHCVACGYNLHGLGNEPRCPECGLLNIPSGYRQQVWDLVDSGRWFFSRFLTPLAKRPPGWWWALDRPGDVRRSFKVAARNVLITAVMIIGVGSAAGSFLIEETTTYAYPRLEDALGGPTEKGTRTLVVGLGGYTARWKDDIDYASYYAAPGRTTQTTSFQVVVEADGDVIAISGAMLAWAVWMWATTALVGLWSQIRKGLPKFARAPRTIIAASNYESHRLLFLGASFMAWAVVDALLRCVVIPQEYASMIHDAGPVLLLFACYSILGMIGWVGPLRSDYTRQLIRSRWHAGRILVMYALVFPWILTVITMAGVAIALSLIPGIDL